MTKAKERKDREAAICAFLEKEGAIFEDRLSTKTNRAAVQTLVREDRFIKRIDEIFSKLSKSRPKAKPYKPAKKKRTERYLNLMLSDLHFQSQLDPREVPYKYGSVEEARRLAAIVAVTCDYKRQYRDDTVLNVHLMGDIIHGQLHDLRDGAPLAEQFASALHLLLQAVERFSTEFKKVVVRCTPGNHGRNKARHFGRATSQKWDSIETMLHVALQSATRHLSNVEIEIPYTPYFTYESFGHKCFMTHGDTVIKPGFPQKNIDVGSVRNQINEINSGKSPDERYSLFGCGHVHTASVTRLPNRVVFITNGCLVPPDAFSLSMGSFEIQCGMQLWESTPDYVVGDQRFVIVDKYSDGDKSLDQIISPFKGI